MFSSDGRIERDEFEKSREQVLSSWETGKEVDLREALDYQRAIEETKRFSAALGEADDRDEMLLQPRAGVPLIEDQIDLLKTLEAEADLLPTTIDSYTRQNRYQEAARGVEQSRERGRSSLNGFPAVNHGVKGCRQVTEAVCRPVEVRHGTPDARLLAEITLAGGFTSFEGGGICYNIPYAKDVPVEKSLRNWQYVDRLVGLYEEEGVCINREQFGPLSGTLIPPFLSHVVAIIEGLLALEQGVRSVSVGYGQEGNMVQDIAAMQTLRELAERYFSDCGYEDYELTTVFHQWMGGFPRDEAKAMAVIGLGATVADLSGASKVIVKTPHEACGVPTKEANVRGLKATRQAAKMVADQHWPESDEVEEEKNMIRRQVDNIMSRVAELGDGDLLQGTVRAFDEGVIDIPFTPSRHNRGRLLPVRDDAGAVRVLEWGNVPPDQQYREFVRERIAERTEHEGRDASFEMVMDDIYAISKGRLVGRPR